MSPVTGAVLKRNVIEKKRNTRVTCCECCSHLFIILLLIYGYALSEVLLFDAETYSTISITIPPFRSSDDINSINSALDVLDGPLPIPSFDAFVGVNQLFNSSGNEDILDLLDQTNIGRRFGNMLCVVYACACMCMHVHVCVCLCMLVYACICVLLFSLFVTYKRSLCLCVAGGVCAAEEDR